MSKISLFCTSLVPALVAGGLSYLMVMTFLERTGTMGTMLMVVCGVTLAASAIVALSPFGILIFSPKTEDLATETVEDQEEVEDDFEDDFADDDDEDEGFGDAIPDDFDPDELADDDDDFDIEDDMEIDDLDLDDQETFELDGDDFDFDEDEFD